MSNFLKKYSLYWQFFRSIFYVRKCQKASSSSSVFHYCIKQIVKRPSAYLMVGKKNFNQQISVKLHLLRTSFGIALITDFYPTPIQERNPNTNCTLTDCDRRLFNFSLTCCFRVFILPLWIVKREIIIFSLFTKKQLCKKWLTC